MNHTDTNSSVALFGSQARGDADAFSDIDLLVVTEAIIDRGRNSFAEAGYSVSSFTWKQFISMANEGSLFIQHLKQEAVILNDHDNRLRSVLQDFRPSLNQNTKLVENLRLFELTRGIPDQTETTGWAFDVLAVAVRNHIVLMAAQEQLFIFSFLELMKWATSRFGLTHEEERLLLDLRIRKNEYRSSLTEYGFDHSKLLATQQLIQRLFGAHCVAPPISPLKFAGMKLAMRIENKNWYQILRGFEAVIRILSPLLPLHLRNSLSQIEATVKKPSPYSVAECGGFSAIHASLKDAYDWILVHRLDGKLIENGRESIACE